MKHEILPNGNLRITFTEEERENLRAIKDEPWFDSDNNLFDILEPLTCNSELEWSSPEEIGALTSAPILATFGEERPLRPDEEAGRGNRLVGNNGRETLVQDVAQAWAFMDYAIRSVQQDLLEKGEAVWQRG